jgi:aspartyl-tRNA(Asn)/glutamyl-tRNA(Gln) amidotransferase subunit A
MLGTHVLSSGYYDAYYLKAGRVRQLIAEDFERIWDEVDVLMAPTTPSAAFKIGEKVDDPLEMYLNDVFTISCNLAGICGVSAPCGFTSQNLPMGMQLMADKWEEIRLLNALQAYQRETDWHLQMPDWKGS